MEAMTDIPPGWYDNPENTTQHRYWDGAAWTDHTAPKGPARPDRQHESSWQVVSDRLAWTTAQVTFRYLESELIIADELGLQLVFSADGNAPFLPVTSAVNPTTNTVSAEVNELGFFYLGQAPRADFLFGDGFE